MKTIGKLLIATAFSASVAAALTGTAASGKTQETSAAPTCATAQWPMIPAECLQGAPTRDVRYVTADQANSGDNLKARFEVAFQ